MSPLLQCVDDCIRFKRRLWYQMKRYPPFDVYHNVSPRKVLREVVRAVPLATIFDVNINRFRVRMICGEHYDDYDVCCQAPILYRFSSPVTLGDVDEAMYQNDDRPASLQELLFFLLAGENFPQQIHIVATRSFLRFSPESISPQTSFWFPSFYEDKKNRRHLTVTRWDNRFPYPAHVYYFLGFSLKDRIVSV